MSLVESKVNSLVEEFDHWFSSRGNSPIIRSERAILKTFCWFLLNEKGLPIVCMDEALSTYTGQEDPNAKDGR